MTGDFRVWSYLVLNPPNICVFSSGVLRLRSVRRIQPGLLYDFRPKQPAQLVEVHALPSSSSFSSSSSLSSTLANTGSQNPPSTSCQPLDNQKRTKTTSNQPLWSSRQQWLHLPSRAAALLHLSSGGHLRHSDNQSHSRRPPEIPEVTTCIQN